MKENPWLGLKSYEENDHLFGREKESDELSNIVINSFHTIIYGKSGIGKTSLLRAGVFPTLRYEDFLPIYIRLEHKENAESDYYLRQIEEIIDNSTDGLTVGTAKDKCDTLSDVFSKYSFGKSRGIALMPVFVFDQFEEIFTLNENRESEAVSRFFADLSDILNNDNNNLNFRIVFCLREDYLYYIESLSESIPAFKRNRYRLQDLTRDEALEVITQPCKGMVDDAVAQEILHKLSPEKTNEVNATILSLYMSQLFDKMVKSDGKTISSSLVRQFGDDIISAFYFDSIEGVSEKTIEYLEDHLVTTGGYRHNVPLEDAIADGVKQSEINHLKDLRILNIQPHQGNILYMEYAHDVLCPIILINREKRTLHKKAKRQRKIITAWVASVFVLLAIVGGMVAMILQISRKQEAMMLMQSRAIAGKAEVMLDNGEYPKAIALSLRALPKDWNNPDRPVSYAPTAPLLSCLYSDFACCRKILRVESFVTTASFSPDGQNVITSSHDGYIRIWDVSTGRLVNTLEGHAGEILSACYSPDGQQIASAEGNDNIRIWNAVTGKLIKTYNLGDSEALWVNYSPNGECIAIASGTVVNILNTTTGKITMKLKDEASISEVTYSPDGKYIVACCNSFYGPFKAVIWDVATGKQVKVFDEHDENVESASFSPDGHRVVTSTNGGSVYVWDAATGVNIKTLKNLASYVYYSEYSPDGRYIVIALCNGITKIYDATTFEEIKSFGKHKALVQHASFSPDNRYVVTASMDGNAMIWDVNGKPDYMLSDTNKIHYCNPPSAFTPDGQCFAMRNGSLDSVIICETATGRQVRGFKTIDKGRAVSYSPDGKYIMTFPDIVEAMGTDRSDSVIRIWNAKTGKMVKSLNCQSGIISAIFSPDCHHIAASCQDGIVMIWDIQTKKVVTEIKAFALSISYSPDGKYLIIPTFDKNIMIANTQTGKIEREIKCRKIASATLSNDCRYLVTTSYYQKVSLWDFKTGKLVKVLCNDHWCMSAVFSPDDNFVVAATHISHKLMVWNVATGEQILSFLIPDATSAAFSPDGKYILGCTNSYGQYAILRFYQPQELIDHFRSVVGDYQFTPEEEIKYYLK